MGQACVASRQCEIGKGSCSKFSRTNCKVPARLAASILYDMTRANPAPEIAAITAASDVFTHSLDRIGTRHSRLPLQSPGVRRRDRIDRYAVVVANLIGRLRTPPRLQIGGTCAHRDRIEPIRVAIMLLSGRLPIRIDTSILSSAVSTTRSVSRESSGLFQEKHPRTRRLGEADAYAQGPRV